jgi:anti-sigma regulatory factor (Ser/Thr protein kinase)
MTSVTEDAYFELSFSPNVALVSTVRRFVSEFYAQVLSDEETTSKLAVATHELLENAVRYSKDGNTSIRISVMKSNDLVRVQIETRNRADSTHVDNVRAAVDEVANAPDAATMYQTLMKRSAKRRDGSGLGLGRVRAETDLELASHVEKDLVHVTAVGRFKTERYV